MQAPAIVLSLIRLPNDGGNRRQSQVSRTPIINHVSLTNSKWSSEIFIIYIDNSKQLSTSYKLLRKTCHIKRGRLRQKLDMQPTEA